MIIDEGLAVGDDHFQKKCRERIEGFRRDGKTLLMVSHSMAIVRTFCTRALWLRRGSLVGDGPIEEIVREYEAVGLQETLSADRAEAPGV
jgi:lipopolysaccharide transport system ATP-binding protein